MSKELKPCRRCGLYVTPDGIEVTQTDTGTYTARFECPDCGEVAETCMRHSSEDFAIADVIDDWNRRWIDPALTARIEELEAERDHFREVAEKLVWLYSDEHQERLDNGLRIDGFYSHEWLGMILDMAREALEGSGE